MGLDGLWIGLIAAVIAETVVLSSVALRSEMKSIDDEKMYQRQQAL